MNGLGLGVGDFDRCNSVAKGILKYWSADNFANRMTQRFVSPGSLCA